MRAVPELLLLLSLGLLAGCMADKRVFPSLAPRAIETIDIGPEAPMTPAPPARSDPAQVARAAELIAAAEAGDRAFADTLKETEPVIRAAAGASVGSERWVDGQQALSRLQAARLATADSFNTIDGLRTAERADPTLDAARERIAALDRGEAAVIDRLAGMLPGT